MILRHDNSADDNSVTLISFCKQSRAAQSSRACSFQTKNTYYIFLENFYLETGVWRALSGAREGLSHRAEGGFGAALCRQRGWTRSLVGPARPSAPKCAEGGLGLAPPEPPAGCRRWKQPREPPQPHPATSAPPRPPCLLFQGSGAALCSEGTELPGARSHPGVGTGARGRWAPEVIPEVIWGGEGGAGAAPHSPRPPPPGEGRGDFCLASRAAKPIAARLP